MWKNIYLTLLLLLTASFAAAQDDASCGFQYTVVRGDSLYAIAEKCNVDIQDIRELNPAVSNLIKPGDVLFLPDPLFEPAVDILPRTANNITTVTVQARNFAPLTGIRIGVGFPGEVALDDASLTTSAAGDASATLTVPGTVPFNEPLYVTVVSVDNSLEFTSEPFTRASATAAPTPQPSLGSGGADSPAVELVSLDTTQLAPPTQPYDVVPNGVLYNQVIIYMVAPGDNGETGIPIGCGDSLIPVQVSVTPTVAPLTASIDALLDNTPSDLSLLTFENPSSELDVEIGQVSLINGAAQINLTGTINAAGTCTDSLILSQMAATALQYPTVDTVQVTVNGVAITQLLNTLPE